ncbi:MAG: hypothetical protein PHC66_04570 [Candidatus Nanoarchaeia archaeon]|nr:hypothetical protein [Candidatus Nanoarchaeia archaeon]MDD5239767.1 hypothetical protein [Candidatus Nanoarchaeia archaeon]
MADNADIFVSREGPIIRPEPFGLEDRLEKPPLPKRIKAEVIFFLDCFVNIQKWNPGYLVNVYSEGGFYKAAGYVALWAKNYDAAVCNYRKAGKHNVANNIISKLILKQEPQTNPQYL